MKRSVAGRTRARRRAPTQVRSASRDSQREVPDLQSPPRPHGLAVRTPAFHAGDHRFESGWGYYYYYYYCGSVPGGPARRLAFSPNRVLDVAGHFDGG